jgi:hypothetical protein
LCLQELLIRRGCTITLHPSVPGSTNRPDFKVVEPGGSQFLLEARSSTEVTTGPEYGPRYNLILDFLRTHEIEEFLLGVNELNAGPKNLRIKLLTKHIDSALSSRVADNDGRVEIPPFESDGWRIRVAAFPRGLYPHRTGLLYLGSSRTWTGSSYPLFKALKKKAGRYGNELSVPLVLAVSSFDAMLTDRDYHDQLLGPHGLWGTVTNPLYRRVSAVLFTKSLWPETLLTGHVESRLYLNPFADRPFRGTLDKLDTFKLEDAAWRRRPGRALCELLELPQYDSSLWG